MNHEWTRMDTKYRGGTTNGHEWTRKKGRGESKNHEWTRMDTNGTTKYRSGTTKNTKGAKKEGRGESRNHEWTRMEPRNTGVEPRKRRNTRKRQKPVVGAVYEPRMHTNNRSRGMPNICRTFFPLVPLTEKAVGFWVLPRGSTAFEMVCDAGLGPATSTVSG